MDAKLLLLSTLLLLLTQQSSGLFNSYKKPSYGIPGPPPFQLCPSLPKADLTADQLSAKMADSLKQADEQIKTAMMAAGNPGGAVLSLVYRDSLLWTGGYGYKNMNDTSSGAPDANTPFRIGSITKLFTSLQTLILRDTGKLPSLDDDIRKYYPEFSVQNPFQTQRGVTFRQLMSHMSGLARNSPCTDMFVKGCALSDAEILRNIAGMRLMYPPGTQPAYSNLGFGLLGKIITKIAKASSWDELLAKMVVQPLGMNNTGNSFVNKKDMAYGYYPDGSMAEFIDIGWDSSAGQSYSTTADLAKLMSLVFSTDKSSRDQLLDGESLREWIEPAYKYPDGSGFSYPWELVKLGNYTLRTKDGAINGYNTEFQMAVESKVGFIFLHSCDQCSSHSKIIEVGQQLLLQAATILETAQAPPSVPPNPQDYVGVYKATVGRLNSVTNITLVSFPGFQALFTTEGGDTALLEWREKDAFQISLRGFPAPCFVFSSGHIGAWVYFHRNILGKVTGLTVPGIAYGHTYVKQ